MRLVEELRDEVGLSVECRPKERVVIERVANHITCGGIDRQSHDVVADVGGPERSVQLPPVGEGFGNLEFLHVMIVLHVNLPRLLVRSFAVLHLRDRPPLQGYKELCQCYILKRSAIVEATSLF